MKLLKYTAVGAILLASGIFFSFGNALVQTPTANAQAGLISAIGSGAAQGLGSCASGFIANEIIGGIAGSIGGGIEDQITGRLGIGTAVPVTDSETQSQIQEGTQVREARESCLDAMAYFAAKEMLNQLADDTLHWVESGFTQFGQPGNRAHIGNLSDFVSSVGDQTFNQFTEEYVGGSGDPDRPAPGLTLNDSCIAPGTEMRATLQNGYNSYTLTDSETSEVVSSSNSGNSGEEIVTGIILPLEVQGTYRLEVILNGITEAVNVTVSENCDTNNNPTNNSSNSRDNGGSGGGNDVCSNFSRNVLLSIASNYYSENQSETGVPASDAIANFAGETAVGEGCELERQIGVGATKSFLEGDFSAGGWSAFLTASQDPNSNPIGAYLSQRQNLNSRLQQSQELELDELRQNNGWVSAIACPRGELSDTTGKCRIPAGDNTYTYEEPVITTPGSVVNETVNNLIGSDFRRLELADEVNEIVGALANQLISNITGSGGNDSQGFFDERLADRTDPLGNINEYSQEGSYNGPIPVDHIASTTAEQIAREEEILSILGQLPTRVELQQLEARLNQCLVRSNPIPEDFQGQDLDSLIPSLFSAHQNIFPGSGLSREREVGPQKVDWVGNDLDWTSGETYGLNSCGGFGNHSSGFHVSYIADDADSGEWEAFMCIVTDGGEFSNDDQNFGASFVNVTGGYDFNFDTVATINFKVPLFEDRSLYRNPRNDRVKIDWDGGDFDWNYYDILAGDYQRLLHDTIGNYGQLRQILNYNPNSNTNRYGATLCDARTARDEDGPGQLSYIVKPGEDQWTEQECRSVSDNNPFSLSNSDTYQFIDTGNEFDAFRLLSDLPTTISEYSENIETLVGDETYDDSYEEPAGGDDLYELLNDVQTITAGDPDSAEISARERTIDARFGRLASQFHSEADLQAARNALELLEEAIGSGSEYRELLDHADTNSCPLPNDWNAPVSNGGGGNNGGDNGSNLISSFSATEVAQGVRVQWQTSAASCSANSNPPTDSWSGTVGSGGSRLIPQSEINDLPISLSSLQLTCTAGGQTDQQTYNLSQGDSSEFYNSSGTQIAAKPLHVINGGDPFFYLLGLIEWNDEYRLYVGTRGSDPVYFESSNLETWNGPIESDIDGDMFMFEHDGEIYGYKADGDEMHLYTDFDGEEFDTHIGESYEWKIDGSVSMHYANTGDFRAFGRVRGNDNPVNEGGWGGDVPPYPEPPFDDRRGISYHENDEFEANWDINRQLVDPADIFDGYHDENEDFVPDFYDPNVMSDGKAVPTVFWKQKSRQVDRGSDLDDSRRYRLTGEIYPVPAIYEDGEMEFNFDYGPVVPEEFHEVRAGDVGWYTVNSNKLEVGEIYMLPQRVEKNGYVYLFYKYRQTHHYEGSDDLFTGVYSYRMKKADFEEMFNWSNNNNTSTGTTDPPFVINDNIEVSGEASEYAAVFSDGSAETAGLLGIPSSSSGNPPPSDPDDWEGIEEDLLIPNEIWGQTVGPINVYKTEDGVGLLYSSKWSGAVRGSIAKSNNGEEWDDFSGNPVMDEFQSWSGPWRVSPGAAVWDGEKIIVYYTDAGPAAHDSYYGMRAIGVAGTKDMVNWEYKSDGPLLTHEDFHSQFSDIIDLNNSTPEVHGRVYPRNAFRHNGEIYLVVQISYSNDGSSARYDQAVIKSPDGFNDWQRVNFQGNIIPEDNIVEFSGKYYTPVKIYGNGGRGATIAVSDHILGPYEFIHDDPLFTTGFNGNHRETVLWKYNDTWHICLGIRESSDVMDKYGDLARIMKCGKSR